MLTSIHVQKQKGLIEVSITFLNGQTFETWLAEVIHVKYDSKD